MAISSRIYHLMIIVSVLSFSSLFSQSLQEMGKMKSEYEKLIQKDIQRQKIDSNNNQLPSRDIPTRAQVTRYLPKEKYRFKKQLLWL